MLHITISAPSRSYSILHINCAAIGCLLYLYSEKAAHMPSTETWPSDGRKSDDLNGC